MSRHGIIGDMLGAGGSAGSDIAETVGRTSDKRSDGKPFGTFFDTNSFDNGFGATCQPDQWTMLGDFEVPSGVEYSWGVGKASLPDNQGYIYVDLRDDSADPGVEVEGKLRLSYNTKTGRGELPVKDFKTDGLDASKSDRDNMEALPEQTQERVQRQDERLEVYFQPASDTAVTVDDGTNSEVKIPVTEYDLTA